MSPTTVQTLMSVFAVAGFAIAKLHTFLSSPVSGAVLKVIGEAASQQQQVEAHSKLRSLMVQGAALFKDLPAIRQAADSGAQAAGATTADVELEAVLSQVREIYRERQQRAAAGK